MEVVDCVLHWVANWNNKMLDSSREVLLNIDAKKIQGRQIFGDPGYITASQVNLFAQLHQIILQGVNDQSGGISAAKFRQQVVPVSFNSSVADEKFLRNFSIGQFLTNELQHFLFSAGELHGSIE